MRRMLNALAYFTIRKTYSVLVGSETQNKWKDPNGERRPSYSRYQISNAPGPLYPFSTAVPFLGTNQPNCKYGVPKTDCSPKRLDRPPLCLALQTAKARCAAPLRRRRRGLPEPPTVGHIFFATYIYIYTRYSCCFTLEKTPENAKIFPQK